MDKITVVCHKDHDKGYEDYVGKCLLCEVERLQKREWVGLTDEERRGIREWQEIQKELGPVWAPMMLYLYVSIEAKLKQKNV